MVLAVWAWILLAFPCFGCMPHRALWRGIGFRLWLQCAGVSLFVVALLGFALLVVASSFCFFRQSERNVREFYGGWFWQVWAWILLGFFCFARMPHRALWLPLEAWILPGFAMVLLLLLNGFPDAVSAARLGTKWLTTPWTWILLRLPCFACGCNVLGFLCLWLHCWGFLCLWLHHLSVSLGRQNATLESFTGDGFGRFGLESCWGSSVSHACPTEPFDFRLRLESCQGFAMVLLCF